MQEHSTGNLLGELLATSVSFIGGTLPVSMFISTVTFFFLFPTEVPFRN